MLVVGASRVLQAVELAVMRATETGMTFGKSNGTIYETTGGLLRRIKLPEFKRLGLNVDHIKEINPNEYATLAHPFNPSKYRIGQRFGANPQVYRKYGLAGHNGLDIPMPRGAWIYACDAGNRQTIKDRRGYGVHIKIQHSWGESIYAHLWFARGAGPCYKGQLIGFADSTGFSTGNHLHFGIRINGKKNPKFFNWVDPEPYL